MSGLQYNKLFFLLLFSSLILSIAAPSCKHSRKQQEEVRGNAKESLIRANKHLLEYEEEQIRDYISRYGWTMKSTSTGLRYMIYAKGEGVKAANDMIAVIEYELKLLNGDLCYSSAESGPKIFVIGKGEVENGLDEALLYMHLGDRAKFIIPSHLAFGLLGDGDRIPSKASLVYDVKLVSLSENPGR